MDMVFFRLGKGLWRKADMMFNMHPRLVTGDGDRLSPMALTYESQSPAKGLI